MEAIEILYLIMVVSIIITCVLIWVIFWKTFGILSDFKESSAIIKKRIKQLDGTIESLELMAENAANAMRGFISSIETGSRIKNKIRAFWEDNKEKDDK